MLFLQLSHDADTLYNLLASEAQHREEDQQCKENAGAHLELESLIVNTIEACPLYNSTKPKPFLLIVLA